MQTVAAANVLTYPGSKGLAALDVGPKLVSWLPPSQQGPDVPRCPTKVFHAVAEGANHPDASLACSIHDKVQAAKGTLVKHARTWLHGVGAPKTDVFKLSMAVSKAPDANCVHTLCRVGLQGLYDLGLSPHLALWWSSGHKGCSNLATRTCVAMPYMLVPAKRHGVPLIVKRVPCLRTTPDTGPAAPPAMDTCPILTLGATVSYLAVDMYSCSASCHTSVSFSLTPTASCSCAPSTTVNEADTLLSTTLIVSTCNVDVGLSCLWRHILVGLGHLHRDD